MADEIPQTGLVLWLSADDPALGLSDGAPVATWPSRVGSLAFTQGTATLRPLWVTGVLAGLPVVRFDGVDDRLLSGTADLAALTQWSIFLVGIPRRLLGQGWFCRVASGSTTADFWWMMRQGETGGATNKLSARWFPVDADRSLHPTSTLSVGSPVYTAWTLNAAFAGALYVAGALVASVSGVSTMNPAQKIATPITLGSLRSAGSILPAQIDVAEVLVYDHALSAADRAQVDEALQVKWGFIPAPLPRSQLTTWRRRRGR